MDLWLTHVIEGTDWIQVINDALHNAADPKEG